MPTNSAKFKCYRTCGTVHFYSPAVPMFQIHEKKITYTARTYKEVIRRLRNVYYFYNKQKINRVFLEICS